MVGPGGGHPVPHPGSGSAAPEGSHPGVPHPGAGSAVVTQGGTQTVSASGFASGEVVHAWLHSEPVDLGVVRADPDGNVRIEFVVPTDLEPGAHTIVLIGQLSGHRVEASFRVVAAPVVHPSVTSVVVTGYHPGSLSSTGVPTASLVAAGLLLLALGGGLLLTRRRRTGH